jgi:hypothetical protein
MGWESEILDPEILIPDPDPVVKKVRDPVSRSATLLEAQIRICGARVP